MPGMEDFVSIEQEDGSWEHVQKRSIPCNLTELYGYLKPQDPKVDISFSKFSQFRPRNCVLAGASATHTVCVCAHHDGMNLMLDSVNYKESYFTLFAAPIKTHHDAIKNIARSDPTSEC